MIYCMCEFNSTIEGGAFMDYELLNEKIRNSGMTIVSIATKTGILRETLYNRLSGKTEFKASEILRISKVLNLSEVDRERIFFTELCELNSTI